MYPFSHENNTIISKENPSIHRLVLHIGIYQVDFVFLKRFTAADHVHHHNHEKKKDKIIEEK